MIWVVIGGIAIATSTNLRVTVIWVVVAGILTAIVSAWLREKARLRQIYLDTLAAFHWDPNMSPVEFEHHCP